MLTFHFCTSGFCADTPTHVQQTSEVSMLLLSDLTIRWFDATYGRKQPLILSFSRQLDKTTAGVKELCIIIWNLVLISLLH